MLLEGDTQVRKGNGRSTDLERERESENGRLRAQQRNLGAHLLTKAMVLTSDWQLESPFLFKNNWELSKGRIQASN